MLGMIIGIVLRILVTRCDDVVVGGGGGADVVDLVDFLGILCGGGCSSVSVDIHNAEVSLIADHLKVPSLERDARELQVVADPNSSNNTLSTIDTSTTSTATSRSGDIISSSSNSNTEQQENERGRSRLEASVSGAADLRHRLQAVTSRWRAGNTPAPNTTSIDLGDSNSRGKRKTCLSALSSRFCRRARFLSYYFRQSD
ncbi:hypothetical protein ElyMa_004696000 [Elysia marginata]|uniref:Uncharacterized protein n=1 Tax=Elysia marginata TaxID=1093978 RepID=A0AAV4I6V6_9GAST|nr:hypothetical protein ElyMa_004696000 [Elysia marginata]